MTRRTGIVAAAALACLLGPAGAFADPDELMPCTIGLVKAPPAAGGNGLSKFVCKGTFALPSPGAAPIGVTATLGVSVDTVPPGNAASAWTVTCTGLGNPPGATGYKCGLPGSAFVIIKTRVVKGIVKQDVPLLFYGVTHPFGTDVAVKLVSNGLTDTKNYCARFPTSTIIRDDPRVYKAKFASAPTACSPSGAFLDGEDAR